MTFQEELKQLINKHSIENGTNTPDFIIARYMSDCLTAFTDAVNKRAEWYGTDIKGVNITTDAPDDI